MTLHLVIHRPNSAGEAEAAARSALREAVWEVADSHWAPSEEAMLVSTDLSAAYLLSHFKAGLAQRGHPEPGMLLVVPMKEGAAWAGMPADADTWISETM